MTDGSAPTDAPQPAGGPGRRRAPRPGRSRWLAAGGVAVLAGVLGLTLALRAGATPACAAPPAAVPLGVAVPVAAAPLGVAAPVAAAPPVGGTVHKGKATFYDSKGAGGNCSYPSAPANRLYVALGPSEYAAGAACGGHLDVTGPKGTVRVLVMDQCPECAPGHLDLSREAFARIADPVQGIVSVSYRAVVDPPLPGPLTFRIKEGASRYWFAVLVADHGNPLRAVEVRQGDSGGWRAAARQDYNYWLVESGVGPGPYSIRVTDVYGHRVTAGGVRLTPGQVQRGTVRMYGGGASAGGGRPAARSASPRPSASPTPRATSPRPSPSAAPASSSPSAPDAPVVPPAAEAPAAGCRN